MFWLQLLIAHAHYGNAKEQDFFDFLFLLAHTLGQLSFVSSLHCSDIYHVHTYHRINLGLLVGRRLDWKRIPPRREQERSFALVKRGFQDGLAVCCVPG